MFYENSQVFSEKNFKFASKCDQIYPLHVHFCFEILIVTEGEMDFTVGTQTRTMRRGDAVMVFPHQPHANQTRGHSRAVWCCFAGSLINHYFQKYASCVPENSFFHLPQPLADAFDSLQDSQNYYLIKGLLYMICGIFDENASYLSQDKNATDDLMVEMLSYIEKNYTGKCTLLELAEELSYDYGYISKYFIRNIGMSFNDYVNCCRMEKAMHLLQSSDMTVLEISLACGFGSLRSFNRNFRELTGKSPRELRGG